MITETTIGNSNPRLYRYIRPRGTVLTWVRTMVATRLAGKGRDWVRHFARHNSGTSVVAL